MTTISEAPPAPAPGPAENKRTVTPLRAAIVGIICAAIVAIVFVAINSSSSIQVPNVVGMQQVKATAALDALGLKSHIVSLNTGPARPPIPGTVVAQIPASGTSIDKGSTVQLNVYLSTVVVPNVVGEAWSTALQIIRAAGLNARTPGVMGFEPPGTPVIAQSPAPGIAVLAQSFVTLRL